MSILHYGLVPVVDGNPVRSICGLDEPRVLTFRPADLDPHPTDPMLKFYTPCPICRARVQGILERTEAERRFYANPDCRELAAYNDGGVPNPR